MDALLAKLGVQAMNYAIRSGIALTSTFAVQQCSRLLKSVDDRNIYSDLKTQQGLLDSKIKIISPAIDLIEFKSGRGNVFLESAVPLARSLHREIVKLGKRLEHAAEAEESRQPPVPGSKRAEIKQVELRLIVNDIKDLLARIDRDIPLLQLAITASGESMSTSVPPGVSPSRLLQASTFLTIGDTQYAMDPTHPIQIGPAFTLSLYMLFLGHASHSAANSERQHSSHRTEEPYGLGEGERKPLWQEVIHKARVRLCRTPIDFTFDPKQGYHEATQEHWRNSRAEYSPISPTPMTDRGHEFAYHLEIIEDLNDGRVHDSDGEKAASYDDLESVGIRESVAVHQISRIFYTDTGRILNIGSKSEGDNNPVLLVKRDINAVLPEKMKYRLANEPDPGRFIGGVDEIVDEDGSCSRNQSEIDYQIQEQATLASKPEPSVVTNSTSRFPSHLDPEWLALEVFVEDDDGDDDSDQTPEDEENGRAASFIGAIASPASPMTPPLNRKVKGGIRERWSLDSRLLAQIRNISIQSSPAARSMGAPPTQSSSRDFELAAQLEDHELRPTSESPGHTAAFVSRTPFGSLAITSSLSLLEMLVRLSSLQAFEQTSHLAIPDHVLTFFLEETSTTGLRGEDRWRARNEAKQRVGFDPYTDSPTK